MRFASALDGSDTFLPCRCDVVQISIGFDISGHDIVDS